MTDCTRHSFANCNVGHIISDTYGSNAFTLVGGEDILWSCVKGGTYARLALRYSTLFQTAEQTYISASPKERALKYGEFWQPVRRQMADEFAKAIVDASDTDAGQASRGEPPGGTRDGVVSDAASSYQRVHLLTMNNTTTSERDVALAVVVSSNIHRLVLSGYQDLEKVDDKLEELDRLKPPFGSKTPAEEGSTDVGMVQKKGYTNLKETQS